jgi:hypothetical protein
MKYYAEINIKMSISIEAKNKKDFIEKVKNNIWDENNIDLDDSEIKNIKTIGENKNEIHI